MTDPVIRIGGDSSDFERVIANVNKKLDSFGQNLPTKGFAALSNAAASVGVAFSAGAFVVGIKSAIDSLDKLDEAAQSAGVGVKSLQALRYAATFAGVGAEELDTALTRLNVKLADAASGGQDAQEVFQRLGINVKNTSGQVLQSDEALAKIADRFASYRDGANKSALAVDLFGRQGAKLIPLLNEGAAGLERLKAEAEKLGILIGEDGVKAASKFNDELDRLKLVADAARQGLAVSIIPFLSKTLQEFNAAREVTGSVFGSIIELSKYSAESLAAPGQKLEELRASLADANQELQDYDKSFVKFGSKADIQKNIDYIKQQIELFKKLQVQRTLAEAPQVGPDTDPRLRGAIEQAPGKQSKYDFMAGADAIAEAERRIREKVEEARVKQDIAEQDYEERRLEAVQKYTQAYLDGINQRAAAVLAGLQTDREAENAKYKADQEALDAFYATKFDSDQEYTKARQELELRHQAALGDISAQGSLNRRKFDEMTATQQAESVLGTLTNVTAGVANTSKAMFETHKALSTAQAIVSTIAGTARALEDYPYPYNIVVAAIVAAAGAAQVAAIQSTHFGSTSVGGSFGAMSAPAMSTETAMQPNSGIAAPPTAHVTVVLEGDSQHSSEQIRKLIKRINEEIGDGVVLDVSGG